MCSAFHSSEVKLKDKNLIRAFPAPSASPGLLFFPVTAVTQRNLGQTRPPDEVSIALPLLRYVTFGKVFN
jgi:hypothetical protein